MPDDVKKEALDKAQLYAGVVCAATVCAQATERVTVMRFELNDEQESKFRVWAEEQMKKGQTKDCTGFRFTFEFTNTTLGQVVCVRDVVTNERLDLSEDP